MKVIITGSFDEKTIKKSDLIESFNRVINTFFEEKVYGKNINEIYIEFNSIGFTKSFKTGLVVGFEYFKNRKAFEIAVKINSRELLSSTSKSFYLIAKTAMNEVLNHLKLVKVKDFEVDRFSEDFDEIMESPIVKEGTYKKIDNDQFIVESNIFVLQQDNFQIEELRETKTFSTKFEVIDFLKENYKKNHFPAEFWKKSHFIPSSKKQINLMNEHLELFLKNYVKILEDEDNIEVVLKLLMSYIENIEIFELDTVEFELVTDKMARFAFLLNTKTKWKSWK